MKKYHFTIYDKLSKRLKESNAEREKEIFVALNSLCDLLKEGNFEWYIVGGLGIYLQKGKITRFHHDIDIEIDTKDVEKLHTHMKTKDYSLMKKILTANIPTNKRMAVYTECKPEECTPELESRVRLVHNSSKIVQKLELLSFIDISFKQKNNQETLFGYHGKTATLNVEYEGPIINIGNNNLRTRNLVYHRYLKESSKSIIDQYDIKTIDTILNN